MITLNDCLEAKMAGNDGVHRSSGFGWATPKATGRNKAGRKRDCKVPIEGWTSKSCTAGNHRGKCFSLKCTCVCHLGGE